MDDFNDWVIQPSDIRINLKDAINLILDFNEDQKIKKRNLGKYEGCWMWYRC